MIKLIGGGETSTLVNNRKIEEIFIIMPLMKGKTNFFEYLHSFIKIFRQSKKSYVFN